MARALVRGEHAVGAELEGQRIAARDVGDLPNVYLRAQAFLSDVDLVLEGTDRLAQ
jgi:hypothetical protein